MGIYGIYSIVHWDDWTGDTFILVDNLPMDYRWKILIISLINSVCSYFFEKVVITKYSENFNKKKANKLEKHKKELISKTLQESQL